MEEWELEGAEKGLNLSDLDQQLLKIAKQLMHKDPGKRPDLENVLKHEYFKTGFESDVEFAEAVTP